MVCLRPYQIRIHSCQMCSFRFLFILPFFFHAPSSSPLPVVLLSPFISRTGNGPSTPQGKLLKHNNMPSLTSFFFGLCLSPSSTSSLSPLQMTDDQSGEEDDDAEIGNVNNDLIKKMQSINIYFPNTGANEVVHLRRLLCTQNKVHLKRNDNN